jgi:hypothetical protein
VRELPEALRAQRLERELRAAAAAAIDDHLAIAQPLELKDSLLLVVP